jgi:hypothetical protein
VGRSWDEANGGRAEGREEPQPLERRRELDENTPIWKVFGLREEERPFSTTLREELGLHFPQIMLLAQDYGPPSDKELTGSEVVRQVRLGLIEVPHIDEAIAELRRRKYQRAAEKRKRTIERKKREAAKIKPIRPKE